MTTIDFTIEKMLIDKLNELKKYGYIVETMSDDTGLVQEIKKAGLIHHKVKISRQITLLRDIKSLYKAYRFFKKSDYDIVHTHTAKAGLIGRIAARLAGIPVVVHTSHGLPFYKGQPFFKNYLYKRLEQIASWFSDGYFSQNNEDLNIIRQFVPKRLLTGYEGNGVTLDYIDNYPKITMERKKELKKELNIDDNSFLFLMGARFEPVKNHWMLIKALRHVKKERPFQILLAGDGPLLSEVKKVAVTYELEDKIKFVGFRNDMLELLQLVDAVILTSEKEGIPRIIMEAMALGKPVLATNVLGTKELVLDGQTGDLVELDDCLGLAKKIELWINPSYEKKLNEYIVAGRKRIEENFTEAKVAQRIDGFYRELIERKELS
ncbi:MAG: glycosyltransferase family 4 protein [Thermincolia bacterium]